MNVVDAESVALVCREAAAIYGIEPLSLFRVHKSTGKLNRSRSVAHSRQLAVALARHRYGWSYPELGEAFGIDHSTAVNAFKVARRRRPELFGVAEAAE